MEKETRPNTIKAVITAQFLVVAAIVVEIIGGADYPLVPPGLLVPLAVGLALCRYPRPAFVAVGLAFGLWLAFGALVAPEMGDHLESGSTVLVAGALLQIVAVVAVIVTSALALARRRRAAVGR